MYSVDLHSCTKFSTKFSTGTCRAVDLVWCSKLKSTGTSLENFPHKISWHDMVKEMFWILDGESCELQAENFQKTLWNCAIDTFGCFRAILYGVSMEGFWSENADLWSVIRDSDRLLGWLSAFWTAGITARPLDTGSTSCTTIFQVSNRTITVGEFCDTTLPNTGEITTVHLYQRVDTWTL